MSKQLLNVSQTFLRTLQNTVHTPYRYFPDTQTCGAFRSYTSLVQVPIAVHIVHVTGGKRSPLPLQPN